MSAVSHLNGEGCLGAAYNFFSQSKVGVTASLIVEAVALIIGILAMTHVLPGVGTIPGAVITGLGVFSFVLTLTLVCSRYYAKERLEQVRENNQDAPLPVPPEECLNILSFLAQAEVPSKLFKEPIPYVEPANEKMKTLIEQCKNKKGEKLYLSIANAFLENLPVLNAFIRSQTQAVLLQKPTEEESKHFKLLNKQIRMILLFLMSHEPKKGEYLKSYQTHVTQSFGNREWGTNDYQQQPCFYFNRLQVLKKVKNPKEFNDFLWVFSIYRRHSLLRLCPTKIEERSKCHDTVLRTLLSATWFHGTRAATTLSDTNFVLMPTGWLLKAGHISFFGEMSVGCQSNGVNANSLSGTYLDRVDWSIKSYATGFQFDIQNEIEEIEEFLAIKIDMGNNFHNNLFQYAQQLPRIEVALKRWARWDQAAFKEKMPSLLSELEHLKEIIAQIEKKKPKEIFAWNDRCYSSSYESLCHSVTQIEAFLSNPLPSTLTKEQKKNIEENFPAVFGSMTLLSEPTSYYDGSGEHLVRGTAQVGKDLQLLCVEKGNLGKANKWVQAHLPDANIQVFSFDQLREAQKINKKVSPYLADIFSLNKFNKLCTAI